MSNCHICKRELTDDPMTLGYDCGGDCRECMARFGEDPEEIALVLQIYVNGFYDEYSALVEKYLAKAKEIDPTDSVCGVEFDVRLQELSNVYGRK